MQFNYHTLLIVRNPLFIDTLKSVDNSILLFINGHHSLFWDEFMMLISNRFIWLPLYLALAFLIYKKYGKSCWLILLFALLGVALSDQLASQVVKNLVMRYRPSHNLILADKLHIVDNYIGGLYGFASSHAANTFSVAVFFTLLMPDMLKLNIGIFCWAAVVCYSRIYLGVHYPSDILGGVVIGTFSAWLMFNIYLKIPWNTVHRREK
jgi:undecaprenyl-diphosphatase